MAKIRYYKDPLDKNKKEDFESESKNLRGVLKELNIENHPLSVTINGKMSEDLSLETDIYKEDEVIIRKPVMGGPSGDSNKVLSNVIQLAALTVALATGVGAIASAAILAAGSLIAGVVRSAGFRKPEVDSSDSTQKAAANVFSITSARNETRQLEPMKVVLGSHRVSPDFGAQPYSEYFNQDGLQFETVNTSSKSALTFDSSDFNSWPTLPSGWISNTLFNSDYVFTDDVGNPEHAQTPKDWGFWPYELSYHPDINLSDYVSNRTEKLTGLFAYWPKDMTTGHFQSIEGVTGQHPMIIYHSDPSDPFFGTYSTLEFILWSIFAYFNQTTFNSVYYSVENEKANFISPSSPTYIQNNIKKIYGFLIGDGGTITNDFGGDSSVSNAVSTEGQNVYENLFINPTITTNGVEYSAYGDFFTYNTIFVDQNTGSFTSSVVSSSIYFALNNDDPEIRKDAIWSFVVGLNSSNIFRSNIITDLNIPKEPRSQRVKHIFHYGMGDIEINDERIANTAFEKFTGSTKELPNKTSTSWLLASGNYESNVKVTEGSKLVNNDSDFSGPESSVPLNDLNEYNWVTRESPKDCKKVQINISGRSFKSQDDGSFSTLKTEFEVQYRSVGSINFQSVDLFEISSFNSDVYRETREYSLTPDKYEFRIRKISKDPEDNREVSEFEATSFNFFKTDSNSYTSENRQGLTLVANTKTGDTQSLNALVESKCWVYNGTDWNWEKTRNPAWWLLYFAKGAFLNESADGSLNYPYSPTIGWVNSAEHPDNLERMFGAGLKESEIDIDKIIEWADFCDSNNLKCDMVLDSDESTQEILERIANVGRASVSYYRGKLSVVVEDPLDVPVGMFGMSNIIKDSFDITYITKELPDKIIGSYSDRDDNWETNTVEAEVPAAQDELNILDVVIDGVTERDQAQREVNILAARQLYQRRRYSWKAGIDGIIFKRGDLVYLSHDLTKYDFSGLASKFIISNETVLGIETNVLFDDVVNYVMIKMPNGQIESYECHVEDQTYIYFDEPYPIEYAPSYFDNSGNENPKSDFNLTVPEDFSFFAGPQEVSGKLVRIESVRPEDDFLFSITALEEEQALYSYEFNQTYVEPENDSRLIASVSNAYFEKIGEGKIKLSFETKNAYAVKIVKINNGIETPVLSSSGATIYESGVILDLIEGASYNLRIDPVVIGQAYKSESEFIKVVV